MVRLGGSTYQAVVTQQAYVENALKNSRVPVGDTIVPIEPAEPRTKLVYISPLPIYVSNYHLRQALTP